MIEAMAIEGRAIGIVFVCDHCGDRYTSIYTMESWGAALRAMRAAGWTRKVVAGGIVHLCEDCANAPHHDRS